MRLLLVYPGNPNIAEKHRGKTRRFPAIGLPVIAALTPQDWDIKIIDEEQGEDVPYDEGWDLVGISSMTSQAARAYDIAAEFRQRGIPVVHGGSHPSVCPEEAAEHGDSVVVGEAEIAWPQLLRDWDCGRGTLKKIYQGAAPDDGWYVEPRRDLVKTSAMMNVVPMVATRGCPYTCSFCSVFSVFGRGYRHRPIEEVAQEIEKLVDKGHKYFVFLDDNIIGNPKWSREFFKRIAPLGIHWGGQSTLGVAKDPETIELARKSGCFSLFIGIESVNQLALRGVRKQFNKPTHYRDQVKVFHDNGIVIISGLIFGFDEDDAFVFERTVEVVDALRIGIANFSLMAPLPGTDFFKQMKAEGRLLTTDWSRYDGGQVVFKPKLLTPEQLQEGADWASREFYRTSRIFNRLLENWQHPLYFMALSSAYKVGHYFHPSGDVARIHPVEKQRLLADFGLRADVPDWLSNMLGYVEPSTIQSIGKLWTATKSKLPVLGQKQPNGTASNGTAAQHVFPAF